MIQNISTQTADDSASISFTSGIDSTYKEYIFKCYNLNPATDAQSFTFQASTDGGSSYGVTVTTTSHRAYLTEDGGTTAFGYVSGRDLAQSTDYKQLVYELV